MVKVGDKAPEFTLLDTERKPRSLSEFWGNNLVLAFFPGAFTAVCTRENCTFRDSMQRLKGQVVAISVDSPFSNKAFAQANNLTHIILSDYNREVIQKYGIVQIDFGGMKGYAAAKRSVFIVDPQGTVRYAWVSDDPGKEPNYKEIEEELAKISA